MTTKTQGRKRRVKTTAMTITTPSRVSRRGRINEGRPILLTAKQFRAGANGYFTYCENRLKTIVDEDGQARTQVIPESPTREGLAVFLSKVAGRFIGTHEIAAWKRGEGEARNAPELVDAVKMAHQQIDAATMRWILDSKSPAGAIFYAKSALGYRDVQSVEQSGPDGKPIEHRHAVIVVEDSPATGGADPTEPTVDGKVRELTDSRMLEA